MTWKIPVDRPFDLWVRQGQDFWGGVRYVAHGHGILTLRFESSLGDQFLLEVPLESISHIRWRDNPEAQAMGEAVVCVDVEVPDLQS